MIRHPGTFATGVVFVVIGAIYAVDALGGWTVNAAKLLPVVLIVIGITVLFSGSRRGSAPDRPDPARDQPTPLDEA